MEETADTLLAAFFDHWLQKDYVAAQKVLDRVSPFGLRDDFRQVLSFRQIADELEKGVPPAKIKPSILRLSHGVESTLLWCGLAKLYIAQAKPNRAKESLIAAETAASQLKDHRRPYLLLNIAKIYASFNASMAALTFKEAVKHFNTAESNPPQSISWYRKVEGTYLSRDFPLKLKGLSGDIADVVPELAGEEDGDVYSTLLTLKDEGLKARSLISYLKFTISQQTSKS